MGLGSKLLLRFAKAPPVGVAIEHDGQTFEIVGLEPYTNRSGQVTNLVRWRTECRTCCEVFEFKTGWSIYYLDKRCDTHKLRDPVDRLKAGRQRLAERYQEIAAGGSK